MEAAERRWVVVSGGVVVGAAGNREDVVGSVGLSRARPAHHRDERLRHAQQEEPRRDRLRTHRQHADRGILWTEKLDISNIDRGFYSFFNERLKV